MTLAEVTNLTSTTKAASAKGLSGTRKKRNNQGKKINKNNGNNDENNDDNNDDNNNENNENNENDEKNKEMSNENDSGSSKSNSETFGGKFSLDSIPGETSVASEDSGLTLVGKAVLLFWSGKSYEGEILMYEVVNDDNGDRVPRYLVKYNDGDREHLTREAALEGHARWLQKQLDAALQREHDSSIQFKRHSSSSTGLSAFDDFGGDSGYISRFDQQA